MKIFGEIFSNALQKFGERFGERFGETMDKKFKVEFQVFTAFTRLIHIVEGVKREKLRNKILQIHHIVHSRYESMN